MTFACASCISWTAAQFVEKVRTFGVELGPVRTTLKEHGYYHAEESVLAVVVGLNRQATFADFCTATRLPRIVTRP